MIAHEPEMTPRRAYEYGPRSPFLTHPCPAPDGDAGHWSPAAIAIRAGAILAWCDEQRWDASIQFWTDGSGVLSIYEDLADDDGPLHALCAAVCGDAERVADGIDVYICCALLYPLLIGNDGGIC